MDSALKQTERDIEVIIADDGSTDGTEALFAGKTDPRVRYCRLPHAGACAARNAGIDLARGKYIAFLDSDDVWRPDKLAVQKRQLETSGADVVFCAFLRHSLRDDTAERCPAEDVPEGRIDYRRLLSGNLVSTQTIFGKAACMKQIRFDERFPRMQDWEYAIRLARDCRLPHAGACAARNAGIDLARGKYIAFLDSDDVWRPDKLAVQKRQLETSGADVVFCAFLRHSLRDDTAERCPAEDVPEGRIDYRRLLSGNLVSTQTIFGRVACMKRIRFDERFPRMQDWEYAIRLARDCRLHYFSDVLADVYLQKDSISVKPEPFLQAGKHDDCAAAHVEEIGFRPSYMIRMLTAFAAFVKLLIQQCMRLGTLCGMLP